VVESVGIILYYSMIAGLVALQPWIFFELACCIQALSILDMLQSLRQSLSVTALSIDVQFEGRV